MQVHRDIMDGRYHAAPFASDRPRGMRFAAGARSRTARSIEGPCFIDAGVVVKTGARIGPTASSAGTVTSKSTRRSSERSSGPTPASARKRSSAKSILGRHCHIGRNAARRTRRGPRRQVGGHRLQPAVGHMSCTSVRSRHLQGLRHPRRLPGRDQRRRGAQRSARHSSRISSADESPSAATCASRRRRSARRSSTARPRRAPTSSTTE